MTAVPGRQIASLFASYGVAGIFWGCLAAATPALQARAGLDDAGFGIALGLMALAALPVMQVFGRHLHRIERWAIPGCMAIFAIGTLALGLLPGRGGLFVGLAIVGAASGALDISLNNRTARVELETGARLFNRTHAVFPAAMLASSALTGGLRAADIGLPLLFGAISLAFIVVAGTEWSAGRHVRMDQDSDAEAPRMRLRGPLLVLALIAAAGAFQEASSMAWAAIFVEKILGSGPFIAGLAPAAFTLGLAVGRFGAHALETRMRATTTVRLAALIALPAFLAIAAAPDPLVVVVVSLFAGIGVGPIEPAVFRATATRADGPERGRALASVTAVAYLGYLISPPVLGLIADGIGWPALWAAAAVLAAGVAALTGRVGRT